MLPLFVHPDWKTVSAIARLWAIVLGANLLGTVIIAALLAVPGAFDPAVHASMQHLGVEIVHSDTPGAFLKAVFAGWLIALMVWMLPSARSARLLVILLLTYIVSLGHFPHIVAGSVEAAFAVVTGAAGVSDYFLGFFLPTLLGNTLGGVALAALLNHAPLVDEFSSG